jgi:preprotein translocase subunit SecG
MFPFLLAIQVLVSISIIALVLLQQGKGADMGAGFGAGASGTVFGSRGSGSFLTRTTAVLATVFFINCILIASPLVRESSKPDDSLAARIEQAAEQKNKAAGEPGTKQATPAPADNAAAGNAASPQQATQPEPVTQSGPAGKTAKPAPAAPPSPASAAGTTKDAAAATTATGKPAVKKPADNDLPQ